ncbi:TlpA family protein disulfide reductase [bacterium]|nr:MAG: TlpA family protein disulfide reductase [bacterium]
MKNSLFLLSLLAISPVASVAQPKVAALQVVIEPAAQTLIDEATKKYQAAQGVRFKLVVTLEEKQTRYSVSYQKPKLLRVETVEEGETTQGVSDGRMKYMVEKTTYKREALPEKASKLWQTMLNNGTGFMMADMLEGRSPLIQLQDALKKAPEPSRMTVKVPPAAVVNGVSLHGIKINYSVIAPKKNGVSPIAELYLWFDKEGLLRRLSSRSVEGKRSFLMTEQISEQQLNPTFEPDAFIFDATGLSNAADLPTSKEELGYDPRLKVGATPIAFEAKDMKGQTITPAKYKGKVLLLDFWATWCGPCVAALPELKSVYAKYHAKGLEVVGISLDEDKNALTSFIKTRQMAWPQIFDGKGWKARVPDIYGVQAIPFTLVIGKNGKITAVDPQDLEEAVKEAIAAK